MATYISRSPAETEALGEAWGRSAQSGLIIGLCGDLGAGKTRLAQGLARGLAIPSRVQSPTFALARIYTGGRLTLYHLDLYRLETRQEIGAAGLEDYFCAAGVTVVEWAERWFGQDPVLRTRADAGSPVSSTNTGQALPCRLLRWVQIEHLSETERQITYEDFGY